MLVITATGLDNGWDERRSARLGEIRSARYTLQKTDQISSKQLTLLRYGLSLVVGSKYEQRREFCQPGALCLCHSLPRYQVQVRRMAVILATGSAPVLGSHGAIMTENTTFACHIGMIFRVSVSFQGPSLR